MEQFRVNLRIKEDNYHDAVRRQFNIARTDMERVEKQLGAVTTDSFQNFPLNLGIGTNNALSASTYGFNPITRVRTLLEWIHRGSWIGGVAVDAIADDMTREGVDIEDELSPEDIERLNTAAINLQIWSQVNETEKWARLYGGAIAVMLVDGQRLETELRVDTIKKGQFKGLLVLDRWMVEPSLSDIVTEYGTNMGVPRFYTVRGDAPGLRTMQIHHSRCLRLEGVRLPYWQRIMENMWGISVYERLYDRMIAFDSATTGAAQLVYKSHLRSIKIKDFRQIVASGGQGAILIQAYLQLMAKYQSLEGVTAIDMEDEFATYQQAGFTGIADAITQFGQQLSGALQIPLVRLFGQSPAGLSSTGESDMRNYYDGIHQRQEKDLRLALTLIYRVMAKSEGIDLSDKFRLKFRPLWQMSTVEKSQVAANVTSAILQPFESGVTGLATTLKELRQSAQNTGVFSNITDEDIKKAEKLDKAPAPAPEGGTTPARAKAKPTGDDAWSIDWDGLPIVMEHPRGTERNGIIMPCHYGHVRNVGSNEPGEAMDCMLGPNRDSKKAWVVNKNWPDGSFDEHKVMIGYDTSEKALVDFIAVYGNSMHDMIPMSTDDLKVWFSKGPFDRPLSAGV